jgi:hypothetical protein
MRATLKLMGSYWRGRKNAEQICGWTIPTRSHCTRSMRSDGLVNRFLQPLRFTMNSIRLAAKRSGSPLRPRRRPIFFLFKIDGRGGSIWRRVRTAKDTEAVCEAKFMLPWSFSEGEEEGRRRVPRRRGGLFFAPYGLK